MQYQFSDKMQNMKPSIIREILKQMGDPSLISFAGGNPSATSFPSKEIKEISDNLLKTDPVAILQYSLTEGVPETRQAVRKFANRKAEIAKNEDDVLIMSGSQQILDFATKCLCNEGDIVAVEEPAFIGAYNAFRSYGAKLVGVPLEKDGVNLDALENVFKQEKKPKFFYCIPNFQNPTGHTTSAQKRKAIYDLAVKYGVPVLEDDPYGELRIDGEDILPIKFYDTRGAVIYAGSFSKILSPGMRLAYCICNNALAAKMVVAKQCCDVHTNVWAQRVCTEFLTNYDVANHILNVRQIYKNQAELMVNALRQKCPALTFENPTGGMFIWASLPQNINMQEFVKKCLENKVAVIPGNVFYTADNAKCNAVRINFSTPTAEKIDIGTGIIAKVLNDF